MLIIDKAKSVPIMVHIPKPDFRTAYEREKYWALEKVKWIEGVGEIPGTLYHYIQEQFIQDRVSGTVFRPMCRQGDLIKHQKIASCRDKKRMLGILKARGEGLSCTGGALTNYFMRVYPGSTSLLTSKEQSAISSLFSEKVMIPFNNYDPDIRPTILNKNETKNAAGLRTLVKFKDKNGDAKTSESQIFCKETTDKPSSATAFSGKGAIFGFYDELPLNKRKSELLKSSMACYRNSLTNEIQGFLLWGGTCEETLTNEDLIGFQNLVNDSELWDTDILFIPFWMGKFMDASGFSDEKKGMEWWEKEAEKLAKSNDTTLLSAFKKNNPRTMDDIFDFAKGSFFDDDVSDKINLQLKHVRKEGIKEVPHILVERESGVVAEPKRSGKVFILEHPKENIDYIQVIDGVGTGTETGETDGSNVASIVMKMFDPAGRSYSPVCIYYERPPNIEHAYINIVSEAKYYNKFGLLKGMMPESNVGTTDHFSTYLKKVNMFHKLMHRVDLSGKGYTNIKKFGQPTNDATLEFYKRSANIFLRKYVENIESAMLLEDLLRSTAENADMRSAFLVFFAAAKDFDKPVVKKENYYKERPHIMLVDGMMKEIWKKELIVINNN